MVPSINIELSKYFYCYISPRKSINSSDEVFFKLLAEYINGDKEELKLRSFAGEPTDHEIIPFGRGICGQVAVSNKNFVVPDVKAQDNYIACSIHVKSEIVVPLFKNGENIGQIDIDSHTADPFSQEDESFLEWVNEKVAEII